MKLGLSGKLLLLLLAYRYGETETMVAGIPLVKKLVVCILTAC